MSSSSSRCLPSLDAVSRSACCSGSSSVLCRPSVRALEGFVFCAGFRRHEAASSFARRWSVSLPVRCRGCLVRYERGFWFVSVPITRESAPSSLVCGFAPRAVASGAPPVVRSAVVFPGGAWS